VRSRQQRGLCQHPGAPAGAAARVREPVGSISHGPGRRFPAAARTAPGAWWRATCGGSSSSSSSSSSRHRHRHRRTKRPAGWCCGSSSATISCGTCCEWLPAAAAHAAVPAVPDEQGELQRSCRCGASPGACSAHRRRAATAAAAAANRGVCRHATAASADRAAAAAAAGSLLAAQAAAQPGSPTTRWQQGHAWQARDACGRRVAVQHRSCGSRAHRGAVRRVSCVAAAPGRGCAVACRRWWCCQQRLQVARQQQWQRLHAITAIAAAAAAGVAGHGCGV
jgi:hypothetical protein